MPLGFMSFRGDAGTDSDKADLSRRDLSCFLMFSNSISVSCRLAEAVLVAFCLPVRVSNAHEFSNLPSLRRINVVRAMKA